MTQKTSPLPQSKQPVRYYLHEILGILPHRDDWLLIDSAEVQSQAPVKSIVAQWRVRPERFIGHFPGRPIMPGVLWIEAAYQTCGILMGHLSGGPVKGMALSVDRCTFKKPALPGNTIAIKVELIKQSRSQVVFQATGSIDDEEAFSSIQTVLGRFRDHAAA